VVYTLRSLLTLVPEPGEFGDTPRLVAADLRVGRRSSAGRDAGRYFFRPSVRYRCSRIKSPRKHINRRYSSPLVSKILTYMYVSIRQPPGVLEE
jgi:hypothetical protein